MARTAPGPAGPSQRVQVIMLVLSARRLPTHRQPTYSTLRSKHHPRPASCVPTPTLPGLPQGLPMHSRSCTPQPKWSMPATPLHSTPLHLALFGLSKFSDANGLPDAETLPMSTHLVTLTLAQVQHEMRWFHCRQAHPPARPEYASALTLPMPPQATASRPHTPRFDEMK